MKIWQLVILPLTFTALLYCWSAGWRDRTCSTRGEHWIYTHRAAEILHDLGIRAGRSGSAQLQQAGNVGGCITLDERVLFAAGHLHQGPDNRIEFIREHGKSNHSAGDEGMNSQLQLLPLGAGLAHSGTSLQPLTVQLLELTWFEVQRGGAFWEDGGDLERIRGWITSHLRYLFSLAHSTHTGST